ncbi:MAG TPA: hypothetical protein VK877_04965 [Pseudolabrys sp.]|nr:hypothetical protein [Pseudolabrys sp.]
MATLVPINGIRNDDHDDEQKEVWQLQRVIAFFELIDNFHDPVAFPQQEHDPAKQLLVLFLPALGIGCRFGGSRLDDAGVDFRPPPAILHKLLAAPGADCVSDGEFPFAASMKAILHQLFREIEHQADGEKPTDNDQDVEHRILARQAINISLFLLTFANISGIPLLVTTRVSGEGGPPGNPNSIPRH